MGNACDSQDALNGNERNILFMRPLFFLVMHGCLDDVYGAEEIVLLISLVIGIICTITGFLKYKSKKKPYNLNYWKLAALKQLRKEWERLEHEERKANTF